MGTRYQFGGSSPERGFDCSGLAWYSHQRGGIMIPRTSILQYQGGQSVTTERLSPGDLLFFSTYNSGASHVGVYAGRGLFIHAPKGGKSVSESSLSEEYWKKRYLGARRYHSPK